MGYRNNEKRIQHLNNNFDFETKLSMQYFIQNKNYDSPKDIWINDIKEILNIDILSLKSEQVSSKIYPTVYCNLIIEMKMFLYIWKTDGESEFIITNNSFDIAICDKSNDNRHKFYVISPNTILILSNNQDDLNEMVNKIQDSDNIQLLVNQEMNDKYKIISKKMVNFINSMLLSMVKDGDITFKSEKYLLKSIKYYKRVFNNNEKNFKQLENILFHHFNKTHSDIIKPVVTRNVKKEEKNGNSLQHPVIFRTGINYNRDTLLEYYKKGSITAKQMLDAYDYYMKAVESFNKKEYTECIICLGECYKIESIMAAIPMTILNSIIRIATNIIHLYQDIKSDIDENARICYMFGKNEQFPIDFLNECIKKYPNSYKFLSMRSSWYGSKGQNKKALQDCNTLLEKYPNNAVVFFNKAVIYDLIKGKRSESIICYKRFINKAPKDHRKIPEAYYGIATHYIMLNHNIKKVKEYYKLGIIAEQNQLPYFLPYESPTKVKLIKLIKMFNSL